jgi:hypothetical protein
MTHMHYLYVFFGAVAFDQVFGDLELPEGVQGPLRVPYRGLGNSNVAAASLTVSASVE